MWSLYPDRLAAAPGEESCLPVSEERSGIYL